MKVALRPSNAKSLCISMDEKRLCMDEKRLCMDEKSTEIGEVN